PVLCAAPMMAFTTPTHPTCCQRSSVTRGAPAMSSASEPLRLRTLLATYPHTAPLHNGDVTSARVALDFKDVKPVWSGFKAMVRRQEFDVSDMAGVSCLVAESFRQPRVPAAAAQ